MTLDNQPVERTVVLRGLNFHWVEWGRPDAPVILALHGLSAMCRIWDTLGQALQDRYRVIALDQRGHGDTSWPTEPAYSTDDYVADIEAFVEHLRLGRSSIVGLSMGGMNAMAYAARHPDRVDALVVVDIRPAFDPDKRPNRDQDERTAREGHFIFPSLEGAFIARKFTHPHTPDASIRHHVDHVLKQLPDGRCTNKHDPRVSFYWRPKNLWSELPKVTCAVLIVHGGQSYALNQETAEEMRAAFPTAELLTIEAAGHTVPEDQPEAFVAAVETFLAMHPSG
jgi:pimeloyl-ACP methyl ester carboxylesterase